MHDFITTYMASQEIETRSRELRKDLLDPDSLYQYEIWDSIGARPSIKERIVSVMRRIRPHQAAPKSVTASGESSVSCTAQHAPQC